jgi:Carboxypeptidase regulatory-like domain
MTGKVADAQGALVPNAEVTVTNVSNDSIFRTTTSEKGEWALASMQPAEYKVSISQLNHQFFRDALQKNW